MGGACRTRLSFFPIDIYSICGEVSVNGKPVGQAAGAW
jgi:hypothetical protein